jgi:hypothetical protein
VPALRLSAAECPTLCPGESHSQRQRVPLSMAKTPTLSRRGWDTQPQRLPLSATEGGTLSRRDSHPQPLRVPLLPQCSRSDSFRWVLSRPTNAPERGTSAWRRSTGRSERGAGRQGRGAGAGTTSQGALGRSPDWPASTIPVRRRQSTCASPRQLAVVANGGAVSRLGRLAGVPTPVHDVATTALSAVRQS